MINVLIINCLKYTHHKQAFYFTAPGRFFNIILTVMKTLGTKKSQEI